MKISNKHKFSFFPIRWLLIPYDTLIYMAVIVFAFILYKKPITSDGIQLDWLQILWHFIFVSCDEALDVFLNQLDGRRPAGFAIIAQRSVLTCRKLEGNRMVFIVATLPFLVLLMSHNALV